MGALQVLRRSGDTTGFVSGWAADADTDEPVVIDVQVDGVSVALTRTDLPRPDVASAFANLNPTTGFAVSFPLPSDAVEVCVSAVSPDDGRRRRLGCQQLTAVANPEPDERDEATGRPTATGTGNSAAAVVYGGIDNVVVDNRATGAKIVVTGWSFDPNDRDRTIAVSATANSVTASGTTGQPNAGAQRIYGVDAACGFELELEPLPLGRHSLEVTATASDGNTTSIGRQTVVVA